MIEEQKDFRFTLKAETASVHRTLEERVTAVGLTGHVDDYAGLLSCFLGLYRPLEDALGRLKWGDLAIDVSARQKSPWLEQDLRSLGYRVEAIHDWPDLPRVSNTNEGLGVLYVMEGASLGGQLIGRWLASELGIGHSNGGRFFSSYGSRIGEMWRAFLDVLEPAAQLQSNATVIQQSALNTFQCFNASLMQLLSVGDAQNIAGRKAF